MIRVETIGELDIWFTILPIVFALIFIGILYPIFTTGLNPVEYWFEQFKYFKDFFVKR